MRRTRHYRFSEGESGFTLPELSIAIAIMGILAAIAIPTWWGVVEGRKVDSATNQVASDLRLAHTSATNRLQNWDVTPISGTTYSVGLAGSPQTRTLSDGTVIATSGVITFNANGSVSPAGSGTITVRVEAEDNASNFRAIEVNTATSRVKIG